MLFRHDFANMIILRQMIQQSERLSHANLIEYGSMQRGQIQGILCARYASNGSSGNFSKFRLAPRCGVNRLNVEIPHRHPVTSSSGVARGMIKLDCLTTESC
jgi:hypothetical protein